MRRENFFDTGVERSEKRVVLRRENFFHTNFCVELENDVR